MLNDISVTEEFQQIDAMVSMFDAEGDGPLRKGESVFNWSSVEKLGFSLAEQVADLRVGIWLLRSALASLQLERVALSLCRLADWSELPVDQLHPISSEVDGDKNIHVLIMSWLATPAFLYGLSHQRVSGDFTLTLQELVGNQSIDSEMLVEHGADIARVLSDSLDALRRIEKNIFQSTHESGQSLMKAFHMLERALKKVEPAALFSVENIDVPHAMVGTLDGELRSRNEVNAMLNRIVAYFQLHEPSHPAPLFLNRVQRMLGCSFEELMQELYGEANQLIAKLERPQPH